MESAASALGKPAGSSWDSPMAPKAGRAEAVKSRKLASSRQEALRRSNERRAREEARGARKLRFVDQGDSTVAFPRGFFSQHWDFLPRWDFFYVVCCPFWASYQ